MRRTFLLGTAALFLIFAAAPLGAADKVTADSLHFAAMTSPSPSLLLRGKVSGVRVSGTQNGVNSLLNTAVRGANSVRTLSEPLWVVDGVILNSSIYRNQEAFWQDCYAGADYTSALDHLSFLNPYDIESIEVLKDLSACALYGARGANGVIIIKTKEAGAEGRSIEWDSNLGAGFGSGAAFEQNHNVSFSGRNGRNSYRVDANLRSRSGTVSGDNALSGGLNVNFDCRANKTVWFGLKSLLNVGRSNSQAGTAWYPYAPGRLDDYDDESHDFRTVDNAYLQINFLPSLHWRTDMGFDYQNDTRYVWYGNGTVFGAENNGAAAILSSSMFQYNVSSKLEYDTYFATHHHFSAAAGVEISGSEDNMNTMNGVNFSSHELRARSLSYSGGATDLYKFSRNLTHLGILGTLSYDYKGIAGVNASLRADNTSRYDDSSFALYPAVDGYFKKDWFSLNAGYGKSGREYYSPYELFTMYSPYFSLPIQEGTESLYDGLIRLESAEWHAGFGLNFLGGGLTLDVKYYQKNTCDTFSRYCFGQNNSETIRWSKGSRTFLSADSSSIRSRGIEADLQAVIFSRKNFGWTLDACVAFQSNQITSIAEADRFGCSVGGGITPCYNELGHSVACIVGFDADGNAAILGNPSPAVLGGLNTTFRIWDFTLDVALDGAAGQSVLNMNRMIADRAQAVSAEYVEKADFLRLGRVSAAYSIPLKKTSVIRSLKVKLSADNLVTLSSYSGYNPDVDSFGKSAFARGIDYGSFPVLRTVMAGISMKF